LEMKRRSCQFSTNPILFADMKNGNMKRLQGKRLQQL
jgi:hypothetical protein